MQAPDLSPGSPVLFLDGAEAGQVVRRGSLDPDQCQAQSFTLLVSDASARPPSQTGGGGGRGQVAGGSRLRSWHAHAPEVPAQLLCIAIE